MQVNYFHATRKKSHRAPHSSGMREFSNEALTFLTEDSFVSLAAVTLKRIPASAVLAAGKWNASLAVLAIETELAAAFVRALAVSLLWIAVLLAQRNIAQVALPTWRQTNIMASFNFMS